MRVVFFCHSYLSDFDHGSAPFMRGVVSELAARGHDVRVFEPVDSWSIQSLVRAQGTSAVELAAAVYAPIRPVRYEREKLDLDAALDGADLVIVHERSDADVVRWIGARRRAAGSRFVLLFHDTHHRSVTDPRSMEYYDLEDFDAVLVFGEAIREVYARRGWARRAVTWHEAADTRRMRPALADAGGRGDVVWIGNDDGRCRALDLMKWLVEPAIELGLDVVLHGTRFSRDVTSDLERRGATFGGWLPNYRVPYVYAQHAFSVHVPRRAYVEELAGVPTIGLFEALACGVPLLVARWRDREGLFRPGADYLEAESPARMKELMRLVAHDEDARRELSRSARACIAERHTCAHRVDALLALTRDLTTRGEVLHRTERSSGVRALQLS